MAEEKKILELFDTVRIKGTELVGFISGFGRENEYSVNYGHDDNQAVCSRDELELLNDD
jgi:hypothetical protein